MEKDGGCVHGTNIWSLQYLFKGKTVQKVAECYTVCDVTVSEGKDVKFNSIVLTELQIMAWKKDTW